MTELVEGEKRRREEGRGKEGRDEKERRGEGRRGEEKRGEEVGRGEGHTCLSVLYTLAFHSAQTDLWVIYSSRKADETTGVILTEI